jgi:hypothetical protein
MDEPNDPAAVFACALSLHTACMERANSDPGLNLSEAYQGMDSFMRELMRVGEMFETWACRHVAFENLTNVWPYLLEERFGDACLETMDADSLGSFDSDDCLRVAFKLRLPMWVDGSLPLPVCVEAPNPLSGAEFQHVRIQTVRQELDEEGGMAPFTEDDDPFDENYGAPVFGIYGVKDALLEHITDRNTYQESRSLLVDLLPGFDFPEHAVAFANTLTPCGVASCP